MDRIGRRERLEILKNLQGLGDGVVAINKGQLRPLRPNTILGALEESIARRNHEGRIWRAFPELYVTENGACYDDQLTGSGVVLDNDRIAYLRDHLAAVRHALAAGACKL